jgi:hypothetical protein
MACAVPIFTKFTATPWHYITIFYTEFYQHRSRSMELTGRKAFTYASKHVTAPIVAISNCNKRKLASVVGLSDCHLYACHTDGTNKQRHRYAATQQRHSSIKLRQIADVALACTDTQRLDEFKKRKLSSYYRPEGPLRESRGIALLFSLNFGTRWGGWSIPRPGRFYPEKDPVPIVQEAGWASEPVWIRAENLAPTGIPSPDLPTRSKSLYQLRNPGSKINK